MLASLSLVLALASPVLAGTLDEHSYHVYRPASLAPDRAVPLVVMFHGFLGSGDEVEGDFGWDAAADRGGFEIAFPDGTDNSWNAQDCCGHAARDDVDDVGFFDDLVKRLARSGAPAIDLGHVYVAGYSNGAMLAYRLACEAKTRIAGIAAVSGVMNRACPFPSNRPSIIAIHGLADGLVRYNGRVDFPTDPTVPKTVERWQKIDDCGRPSATTSGTVTTQTATCTGGRVVELISVAGAGHQWPGARWRPDAVREFRETYGYQLDRPSTALDATRVISDFFASVPR